ncbi:MAG TPA: YciI family protein [Humibacter sp.]|nr:YciI family protein [Humibacter sp.]
MRFQILIYNNSDAADAWEGEMAAEFDSAHAAVQAELRASGELVDSNELSTTQAKVVRLGAGDAPAVTDGPFAETKEWVGGYYTVECDSVERAVQIASRFLEGRFSPIEVRQLVHAEG